MFSQPGALNQLTFPRMGIRSLFRKMVPISHQRVLVSTSILGCLSLVATVVVLRVKVSFYDQLLAITFALNLWILHNEQFILSADDGTRISHSASNWYFTHFCFSIEKLQRTQLWLSNIQSKWTVVKLSLHQSESSICGCY